MSFIGKLTGSKRVLVAFLAAVLAVVIGAAITNGVANASGAKAAASTTPGQGTNDFGMTHAYFKGKGVQFTYSHGYFCDTSVAAASATKCEAGQKFNTPPGASGHGDPLFITVPLGFTPKKMVDCPPNLTCVDHPSTIDLSRLEPALKPLYPQYTDAQLTAALKDFATPAHDHFITTKAGGKREWWDVQVIGVTNKKTYQRIQQEKSYKYIRKLIRNKNAHVVGPIPTNLFLFFSVQR